MILLAIENIDNFETFDEPISDERLKKADNFKSPDDKKRCLLAEVLLRKALKNFKIDIGKKPLTFKYNEYNKPYLKDFENAFFNISHSGKYVVCAVSNSEVGLDIEEIKKPNFKIAERYFSINEYKDIKTASDFYKYWVLKESYIKYIGSGLHVPLNSFDVNDKGLDVNFIEIDSILGYKCAICSKDKKSYCII